jgi:uncharacterized surface protein with fasciclin (FAS1) repeats
MDQSNNVSASDATRNLNTGPKKNIIDTMVSAGHFGTFVSAVHAAGLTDELATKGPFTVFAPTDAAFKKLAAGGYDALVKDAGRLKAILNYHVVSGYYTANDVKPGDLMTLQGSSLTVAVKSPDVRVNGTRVTKADCVATNGIVHAIDEVILPKNWQLLAAAA